MYVCVHRSVALSMVVVMVMMLVPKWFIVTFHIYRIYDMYRRIAIFHTKWWIIWIHSATHWLKTTSIPFHFVRKMLLFQVKYIVIRFLFINYVTIKANKCLSMRVLRELFNPQDGLFCTLNMKPFNQLRGIFFNSLFSTIWWFIYPAVIAVIHRINIISVVKLQEKVRMFYKRIVEKKN